MADLTGMLQAAAGTAASQGGYQIERSLRFNAADTTYLQRTLGTPTSRTTMTFSFWTKIWSIGKINACWNNYVGSLPYGQIVFQAGGKLEIYSRNSGGTVTVNLQTTALYRDPSAWYHVVIAVDTTQATSSDRVKSYVNGEQVTSFSASTYPSQNSDVEFQVASRIAAIGRRADGGDSSQNLSAYLADYFLIDGQALTPSDFGEFDTTTGVWKPKEYTGTYGTNGFHLDFSDNTSTTTLGYDAAGSNDWTLNNFSVAAGAGNDSLVDTPTPYGTDTGAGGTVRGNYCTLNALANGGTLSNGNLQFTQGASHALAKSTFAVPTTGLWYAEATVTTLTGGANAAGFGLGTAALSLTAVASSAAGAWEIYASSSIFFNRNATQTSIAGTFAANDVIQIAVDLANSRAWVGKNNTWYDGSNGTTGDPAAGSNPTFTSLPSELFVICNAYSNTLNANFGQRPFAYTAPSGFKALCTQNLPDPTVVQGDDYFNTVLYTGTGSSQSITGVGFQPDWVWIKARSLAYNHRLVDAVRGVGKELYTSLTDAETTNNADGYVSAFNTDGFSIATGIGVNQSSGTYVAWNWNAGGSNATNTDGTITSTVRANPTAGFSIVSYVGTGSNATVGHGLGVAPKFLIVRNRDTVYNWRVWHTALSGTQLLYLNTTASTVTDAAMWNSTTPTSSVFSLGTNGGVNENTKNIIAYCFAEVEGFSKFGSYTANGSTDGPFIYCGFRPAFIICKRTSTTGQWGLLDDKRPGYNVTQKILFPNGADAEVDGSTYAVDFTSNGFKIRNTGAEFNQTAGQTYIFIAFAENPFKYSLAR